MARKINFNEDEHEIQCSECEVVFTVIWSYDGFTLGVSYCPFCGVEFDGWEEGVEKGVK